MEGVTRNNEVGEGDKWDGEWRTDGMEVID